MVYRDDSDPPIGHQPLPYRMWDDNGIRPTAPANGATRSGVAPSCPRHGIQMEDR